MCWDSAGNPIERIHEFTACDIWKTSVVDIVGRLPDDECMCNDYLQHVIIGKHVTAIGARAFYRCESLRQFSFKEGSVLTTIENDAFYACSELTTVSLPDSITDIKENAFIYCDKMPEIVLPDKLTGIAPKTFYYNKKLTNVTIGRSVTWIGDSAFLECPNLQEVVLLCDNLQRIEAKAFSGTRVDFEIPNTVTYIGDQAFRLYRKKNVILPDSIKYISEGAFRGCEAVNFEICDTLTYLGPEALLGASFLTSFRFPRSISTIPRGMFSSCTSLVNVTIPDWITVIDGAAFHYCYKLVTVELYGCTSNISRTAFTSCRSLVELVIHGPSVHNYYDGIGFTIKNLTLLDNVEYLCDYAFKDFTNLTTVFIPNSVKSIGTGIFTGCWYVTGFEVDPENEVYYDENGAIYRRSDDGIVQIPFGSANWDTSCTLLSKVKDIGDGAFCGLSTLKSVVLSDSAIRIGNHSFDGCSSLASVVVPDPVLSIGDFAFHMCSSLTTLKLGKSVASIGMYAFYDCHSLNAIEIPDSVKSLDFRAFMKCTRADTITLGKSLERIYEEAFSLCLSLKSVVIPNSVTYIGDYGFYYCGFKDLTIGNSVSSMGSDAFRCCINLTRVTIPELVTEIRDYAFYDCTSLVSVTLSKETVSIGVAAFCLCESLTSIVIPGGVVYIGDGAFFSCTSLTSVTAHVTEDPVHGYGVFMDTPILNGGLELDPGYKSPSFCDIRVGSTNDAEEVAKPEALPEAQVEKSNMHIVIGCCVGGAIIAIAVLILFILYRQANISVEDISSTEGSA